MRLMRASWPPAGGGALRWVPPGTARPITGLFIYSMTGFFVVAFMTGFAAAACLPWN